MATPLIPTLFPLGPRRSCDTLGVLAAFFLCAMLPAQDLSHPDTPPTPSSALIQQANDALAAGNLPAALKILTDLNTQTPHNPQVLYDLGFTLESLAPANPPAASPAPAAAGSGEQPTGAAEPALTPESCYRQAISADPSFPAPQVALGLLLARTGHPVEARAQLLAATALAAADPALKARAFRALARLDLNAEPPNPPAASDDLLNALKLAPEQPADILLSAQIAEAAQDLPSAEQAYRRYLATPGNAYDAQAISALAHILLAQHHPAEAEALLTPALAEAPSNPSFTAQLAEAWLDSGDAAKIARAAPLVQSLHDKLPANTAVTRLLARIYVETGHPDQADPLYAALIDAQPDHPDPTLLDDRAEALLRLHRPGEAEKLLKLAVAEPGRFPTPADYADAATHLAFAAVEIDDPRMTLQALALRATVLPPSPPSLFLEATANDDLHQSSKAIELYHQFLAAANGSLPDQESQARRRLAELEHTK